MENKKGLNRVGDTDTISEKTIEANIEIINTYPLFLCALLPLRATRDRKPDNRATLPSVACIHTSCSNTPSALTLDCVSTIFFL